MSEANLFQIFLNVSCLQNKFPSTKRMHFSTHQEQLSSARTEILPRGFRV